MDITLCNPPHGVRARLVAASAREYLVDPVDGGINATVLETTAHNEFQVWVQFPPARFTHEEVVEFLAGIHLFPQNIQIEFPLPAEAEPEPGTDHTGSPFDDQMAGLHPPVHEASDESYRPSPAARRALLRTNIRAFGRSEARPQIENDTVLRCIRRIEDVGVALLEGQAFPKWVI